MAFPSSITSYRMWPPLSGCYGRVCFERAWGPDLVFLETIGDSTFHLLQCAEERILWSCPGKDTPDQSEASRFGQRER